ncbi:MAG: DUF6599 family protein [Acidobacteriota bacterium]
MSGILAIAVLSVSTLAFAAPAQSNAPATAPLLPQSFAGYTQTSTSAIAPDPADAAVLHEYGLAQSAAATYTAGSRQLTVRAFRFGDATGAYGAFTYFRQPGMQAEPIGRAGAGSGNHHLFWNGSTVMDAAFAQPSVDAKSALTALAALIPSVGGAAGIPPSLPHYLPTAQLNASSVKYAFGPAAYAHMQAPLPASAVDFGLDTEVVTAQYGAEGNLMLLLYPTPQIAGAHLKSIDALAGTSGLVARRAGPLVAVVSGSASPQRAQQLVTAVHFDDYVTINHPEGYVPETVKLYRLLMGITMLIVILFSAALIFGIFFGGGRALIRRLRGKPVSTVSEEEFISLHLN